MSAAFKDFGPIQDAYAFFEDHSTEAEADSNAYAEKLAALDARERPLRLLDFGCGPGRFTERVIDRLGWTPAQLQITLVEPVEDYRRQAVERLGPRSGAPVAASPELPEPLPQRFDVILANHVLYYVSDLETTVDRLSRAIAPGGLWLSAIAGWDNTLLQFWKRWFAMIGAPVPYHTAESVLQAIEQRGIPHRSRSIRYDLIFPDTVPNRLAIMSFLMADHLPKLPRDEAGQVFDDYRENGRIAIRTTDRLIVVPGRAD